MRADSQPICTDTPAEPLVRRRFEFARDTFAFANQLLWAYDVDPSTGQTRFSRRVPVPTYAHRCFVLTRAARQFHYHADFRPSQDQGWASADFAHAIRSVLRRNPRQPCALGDRIIIPSYSGLREFSQAHEALFKRLGGGAWRSYVLRSHWRMVFPISRTHQARTAERLTAGIRLGNAPIVHLVDFPRLKINHGMILYAQQAEGTVQRFDAYDPNVPAAPCQLSYDQASRTFTLPANSYWAGGRLNVIEIFRTWWM